MQLQKPAAHTPSKSDPTKWHDLDEHLQEVAKLTRRFAEKLKLGQLGYYAGLWHDLGKYNPAFQEYLRLCHEGRFSAKRVPHAIHGAILADTVCPQIAPLIYGHHAGLPDYIELDATLGEFLDNPKNEHIYAQVLDLASQDIDTNPNQDFEAYLEYFSEKNNLSREVCDRLLFSCLIDADRLDTEEFDNPEQAAIRKIERPKLEQLWKTFDKRQKDFISKKRTENVESPVFQIRQEVYDYCLQSALQEPGVFRLTVPTGGGKTLSGLAFALKHATQHQEQNGFERVIVAVPYTSIIEQTVKVYREIFEGHQDQLGSSVVLEHHSAVKSDLQTEASLQEELDEGAKRAQRQARLATQNWDAQLIVTTTVQLFESLFSHRTSKCRKLHNIVGSVIILDEVQTLPIALRIPICSMLEELVERYRISVVLCTATQPVLESDDSYFQGFTPGSVRDIVPPNIAKEHFQQLKRVNYDLSPIQTNTQWSWGDLAHKINSHEKALIVLNTRKDALNVLESLEIPRPDTFDTVWIEERVQDALRDSPVLHLSTLLCGAHRRAVLDEIRDRLNTEHPKFSQRCILVSTQVVEAGVDLDFPAVYRALGPLDRIVQAAGRCNREGRLKSGGALVPGKVTIFELEEGSIPQKGSEYAKVTEKTRVLLQRISADSLHDPSIFEAYGRSLYQVEHPDKHSIQEDRTNQNYRKVAAKFKLIDDDTVPVIVPYNQTVQDFLNQIRERGLWSTDHKALQPYVVSLRQWEFQKHRQGSIAEWQPDFYVWTGSYDPIQGLPLLGDPSDGILLPVEQLMQ